MRSYLARMVAARQPIPRGELVMRLTCLAAAALGVLISVISPWRALDMVASTIALTGVIALTVTIMLWDRYKEGSWRAVLWTSRAQRQAAADRAARLRLPKDPDGQQG